MKEPKDVVNYSVRLSWKLGKDIALFSARNLKKAAGNLLRSTFELGRKGTKFAINKLKERDMMKEEEKVHVEKVEPVRVQDYEQEVEKPKVVSFQQKLEEKQKAEKLKEKQKAEKLKEQARLKERENLKTFDVSQGFIDYARGGVTHYKHQMKIAEMSGNEFAYENARQTKDMYMIMHDVMIYDGGEKADKDFQTYIEKGKNGEYGDQKGVRKWFTEAEFVEGLNKVVHFGEASTEKQTYKDVLEVTMIDISKLNYMADYARKKGDRTAEMFFTHEMNDYYKENEDLVARMEIKNDYSQKIDYTNDLDYYSKLASKHQSNTRDLEARKTMNIMKSKGQVVSDYAPEYMKRVKEMEKKQAALQKVQENKKTKSTDIAL